jgi:hypothetical protein
MQKLVEMAVSFATFYFMTVLWSYKYEQLMCLLIIKANKMHYFWTLFGKELYMFRTDLLSIIKILNTVFTTIGVWFPCVFFVSLCL